MQASIKEYQKNMTAKITLCIIFCIIGIVSAQAQWEKKDSIRLKNMLEGKEEITINEDVLKDIQFNFIPEEELHRQRPITTEEKAWMKFDTKLPEEYIKSSRDTLKIKFDLNFEPPHTAVPLATFNADKFFFENFTKRGRAIRHNRKHAQAWKIYNDYQPTYEDSLKWWGNEKRIPKDTLAINSDSVVSPKDSLSVD